MKPFRVIHVAETLQGGIATYLSSLIPLQIQRYGSDSLQIIAPENHLKYIPELDKISLSGIRGASRILRAFRCAIAAVKSAKKHCATHIHLHSTYAGFAGRLITPIFGRSIKIVYCPHGWAWDRYPAGTKKQLIEILELFFSIFTDRIVCISEHDYKSALRVGINPAKLVFARNAISTINQKDAPNPTIDSDHWPINTTRLLFVGRLDKQKGADLLPEIARLLGSEFFLVVAGSKVIETDSDSGDAPANMKYLGWRDSSSIQSLYNSAEILLVPSRWEGFGLVALEAMRAGVCVICSNCGGLPEMVLNGQTGLVVEKLQPKNFADAIRSLDKNCIVMMGNAGQARFTKLFSIERLEEEIHAAYST